MNGTALHYLSLTELSDRFRDGRLSPVEVTQAMLDRIGRFDGALSSYITVLPERALEQARAAEAEIGGGLWRGPLHGVPIAVKDLCDTEFAPSTAGMKIHAGHRPASNATVIDRLEAAGAVLLGKLAMTEGAFIAHHPEMPTPRNPWSAEHWSGVSSSGSGVATAAGLCYASLGSDTGGSIRFPSAYCGLTGVKPTWGRVSRHGVFALAESLDHVGPMARNAADAAAVLGVIAGRDPRDPTSLSAPVPDYLGRIGLGVSGLRLGIDERFLSEGTDPRVMAAIEAAITVLEGRGVRRSAVGVPSPRRLVDMWLPLTAVEAGATHAATFPSHADDYGPQLRWLLEEGQKIDARTIVEGHRVRQAFAGDMAALFEDIDLLIVPVSGDVAPLAAEMTDMGEVDTYRVARYAAPFDFTGQPTITLQGGVDQAGVPIGFQLVARHLDEDLLFRAAHAYQQRTEWHTRHPAV
jgi:amidase